MSGLHSPHWCRFFPGLLRTWLTTFLLGPSLISIIVKQSTSLSKLSYTLYLVMTNKEQCCNCWLFCMHYDGTAAKGNQDMTLIVIFDRRIMRSDEEYDLVYGCNNIVQSHEQAGMTINMKHWH